MNWFIKYSNEFYEKSGKNSEKFLSNEHIYWILNILKYNITLFPELAQKIINQSIRKEKLSKNDKMLIRYIFTEKLIKRIEKEINEEKNK